MFKTKTEVIFASVISWYAVPPESKFYITVIRKTSDFYNSEISISCQKQQGLNQA